MTNSEREIRIALVGIGNCASSLVQGLHFYKRHPNHSNIGLLHPELGGYRVEDIRVVCAFDIDRRKVGRDLSEAIFAPPNCTKVFQEVKTMEVKVQRGPVMDGVAEHMSAYPGKEAFRIATQEPVDVARELKASGTQILINYLPVGSDEATKFYAQSCLEAGVAMINCIPVFIASDENWVERFEGKGLPVLGDDIKSQMGATIIHRVLTKLFEDRGLKLDHTYQLNVGGNTDFLNMLERGRLKSKKISKTEAVQSQLEEPLSSYDIHVGPSDYVPWLDDNKIGFIRMEGREFGNVPVSLDLRLSVEDSPNSGGMVIDAIRACKLALDRGIGGALTSVSCWTMKHPPKQYPDREALKRFEEYIQGERER